MSAPEATIDAPADELTAPPKNRRATRMAFVALGITVYVVAVSLIGWRKVGDTLAGADLRLIGFAAVLTGTGAGLRMWKWRRALGANGNAIGLYFLSRSGGVWSPARVGEFLPLLWRRHRNTRLAAWILFDRLLEVLTTLALGLAGLAMIRLLPVSTFIAVAVATVAAAAAGLFVLTRADVLTRMAQRFGDGSRIRTVLSALARTSGELRAFLSRPTELSVITLVAKSIDLYAITLIFAGLNATAGFALVAASKSALAIVSYVPITPMTTGIPHTVQGWIMHESAGISPETVVASVGIEAAIMMAVFSVTALVSTRAIQSAAV